MTQQELPRMILLGDFDVGKTSVMLQFVNGCFYGKYNHNGIEDAWRKCIDVDGRTYTIEIFDPDGARDQTQRGDEELMKADGYALVYSVTSRTSFDNILAIYYNILVKQNLQDRPIVVIATKIDLEVFVPGSQYNHRVDPNTEYEQREVQEREGEFLADRLNAAFFETTARRNKNCCEPFIELTRRIIKQKKKKGEGFHSTKTPPPWVSPSEREEEKQSCILS